MVNFDATTHTFTNEEGKKLISITTLLAKHNLAPSYENISTDFLKKYSDRGTLIHEEISNYIKTGEVGFSKELQDFIDYTDKNEITFVDSEFMLYNDHIAGICDFLYKDKEGKLHRVDFKTTSTKHNDSVSWQLSLYDYLDTRKADYFEVWYFQNNELEVVSLRPKEIKEIEKLIEDDKLGITYTPTLEISLQTQHEIEKLQIYIDNLKALQDDANKKLDELKSMLVEKMETHNIKKITTDYFTITYVEPSIKKTIDSKRLKKELPQVYEEYTNTTQSKGYVKIKIKEKE